MAFVPSLAVGEPFDFSVATDGSEFVAQVTVGYDDASDTTVSVVCALSPMMGYGHERYELIFTIVEVDQADGEQVVHYDGLTTKELIPDASHRRMALWAANVLTEELIDQAQPHGIVVCTHTAYLPSQALTKFNRVTGAICDKGYRLEASEPRHGRYMWIMERCH